LYAQAIEQAREIGYPQDEAIACELAAKLYVSINKRQLSETYLLHACEAYDKWGAIGKIKYLQEKYPFLAETFAIEEKTPDTEEESVQQGTIQVNNRLSEELDKALDMDMLKQASKLGWEEKKESQWLEDILELAVRNAGAEKGLILLRKEGQWFIEAEKHFNNSYADDSQQRDSHSSSIVQYVIRTGEAVVIGDARQSLFSSDPYIRQRGLKSVICMPIRYPDHQDGVLYMENNLTSEAFAADRLEVLDMIVSRITYVKLWQSASHADEAAAKQVKGKAITSLIEPLSKREVEILHLIAEGLSNKEVAVRLGITEGTVKIHTSNMYGKLQVKRRGQAVSKARALQLLD